MSPASPTSGGESGFGQTCERFLQASRKLVIRISNLAKQSLNHDSESPREFGGVQLLDERAFELRGHSAWQQVHATAVGSRKAVANTGQRERIVAHAAYHVFRLPQFSSGNAAPHMECIQPSEANDIPRQWWGNMLGLIRFSEHKPKRWRQGSEFRRGCEGDVHLQSVRKEKNSINPPAGPDVNMMQGEMLLVHVPSPIGEDVGQFGGISDAKSEVYVRPPIFAMGGCRTSDRCTTDALVSAGVFQQAGSQAITFFRCKHRGPILGRGRSSIPPYFLRALRESSAKADPSPPFATCLEMALTAPPRPGPG